MNIKIKIGKLIEVVSVVLEEGEERRHVLLIGYRCKYFFGEIKTENDEEWMWADKSELKNLKMTPGSEALIPNL